MPWRPSPCFRPQLEALEDRCVPAAFVRVNQLGYEPTASKIAWLIADAPQDGAAFEVRDNLLTAVMTGTIGADQGPWNTAFSHVYAIDFTALQTLGTYTVFVDGGEDAESPVFRIDTSANLYASILDDAAFFYRAQRDGPDVDNAVLNRQPAHLDDALATVYRRPSFTTNGRLADSKLTPIGGPIDVAGGWFDAGDYLKFVATASYTAISLLMAVRDHPGLTGDLAVEARHGLEWLLKMWDDTASTLYIQVGLASGNSRFLGDHDAGWRLPEADDLLDVQPDDAAYFVRYRPVFRAAAPGAKISPNLAGRMAAAFALGFQVYQTSDPAFANQCLLAAQHIFDLAKTKKVTGLVTTYPRSLYRETEWRDDLELGAAELYHAVALGNLPAGTPHTDPLFYVQAAARWAHRYLVGPNWKKDTLNWRDVSALGHYETHRAISGAGNPAGLLVTPDQLVDHLQFVLQRGQNRAAFNGFRLGVFLGDSAARVLGLALTAQLYEDLTGLDSFVALEQAQIDWVFGSNAWGTSFLVGTGSVFPHGLHHQIANLSGNLQGQLPDILRGAVVFGPASTDSFDGLGLADGMNPAAGDVDFALFTGNGVRYFDNAIAWPCVEPAIDYSALLGLLFARQIDG